MISKFKIALLLTSTLCLPFAGAQDYPIKPVKFVIPLTPGSGADIAGRIVAKHLTDIWKQPVVVENRPGAGGQIGTQAVIRSEPDGYTLLVQSASHAANPAIYKKLPYDPLKELVDVSILGVTPYLMVTAKGGEFSNLKALIDAAKSKPNSIPFASAGVGSSTHLVAEYFAQIAGIKMIHIPYKGSPEAIQDTISGRTSFYMAPINAVVGQMKEGKLAALGVTTSKRAEVLPEIASLAEQGLGNFNMTLWFGVWSPAGTPAPIVDKINAQIAQVLQIQEVKDQFAKLGINPIPMKPSEFSKFVRDEINTYQKIVKEADIQPL